MVRIVIGNIYSKIVGYLPEEVSAELSFTLCYKDHNARYIKSVIEGKWDGYHRLFKREYGQSFYTGLMSFVREILDRNKIEYTKEDLRHKHKQNLPHLTFTPPEGYEDRNYQILALSRGIAFTRGLFEMATGSGKTLTIIKLISELKVAPFIFVVLTKDLMQQAYDEMSKCLNEPIGRIGDGICDIKNINVMTVQTAIYAIKDEKIKISDYQFDNEDVWNEKMVEDKDKKTQIKDLLLTCKGVYFDETHHAAAKTCIELLSNMPDAYYHYGGSATITREDNADIVIQAMFGAKIVSVSASYLIRNNYLVKPYIFFSPIEVNTKKHTYQSIYKEAVVDNQDLNDEVVATAKHLMERGLIVLILVQFYNHGNKLKKMIEGSEFVTGKMTTKKRTKEIDKLRQGKRRCLIATSLADEGVDWPSLNAVILAGGGKSVSKIKQRVGRVLRRSPGKNKAIVVVYEHKSKYLKVHSEKVYKMLKKEKEFVLIRSKGGQGLLNEIDNIMGFEIKNDMYGLLNG